MVLKPVQRPHPPLWYGMTLPENADWPAANDVNIVALGLRPTVRTIVDRYRAARAKLGKRPATAAARRRPAMSWWPRPTRGAGDRAPGLSALARELPLAVRAPWRRAADRRPLSADLRRTAWRSRTASRVRRGRCAISSPPRWRRAAATTLLSWFAFGDMTLAEQLARSGCLPARSCRPSRRRGRSRSNRGTGIAGGALLSPRPGFQRGHVFEDAAKRPFDHGQILGRNAGDCLALQAVSDRDQGIRRRCGPWRSTRSRPRDCWSSTACARRTRHGPAG